MWLNPNDSGVYMAVLTRGVGYMVSGWEQGEPGMYWARVWLAPVKDFSSMGDWQKGSHSWPLHLLLRDDP